MVQIVTGWACFKVIVIQTSRLIICIIDKQYPTDINLVLNDLYEMGKISIVNRYCILLHIQVILYKQCACDFLQNYMCSGAIMHVCNYL